MLVGISGTNWTGKTSTIDTFCSRYGTLASKRTALNELVYRSPFPMIENQTPDGSRWVVEQLGPLVESASGLTFFDRSPLDVLAFTTYSFDREARPTDPVLLTRLVDLAGRFDFIFFCELADAWPPVHPPGPAKVGFALLMDWYMRRVARTYSLKVVPLPWSLDERQRVLDHSVLGKT